MTLYRLKLFPKSPWRTPWQADTFTGLLLATCARTHGAEFLLRHLIEPMLNGKPPFVISDAMPGDLLPAPIVLRLSDWPEGTDHKHIKRACWLAPDVFLSARTGQLPDPDTMLTDAAVFQMHTRQHNTLTRDGDTTFTAEEGGGIYQRSETTLRGHDVAGHQYLSLYLRILDPDAQSAGNLLLELLHELSSTGFGADISTGRGQFDLDDQLQAMSHLDQAPRQSDAVVTLSTFQPGPADPVHGYWDAFPKFGKFSPEITSIAGEHRKNTLILFKPGACFRTNPQRLFLGRAIPMKQLLPAQACKKLADRNYNLIHPAFALTIPAKLPAKVVHNV